MLGQHGHIVGVVADLESPGLPEADGQAGHLGELGREVGIAAQREAAELEELALGNGSNDLLYQLDASRDYDPSPKLGAIRVPLVLVNSGDDFINPPELGIAERELKKIPHARFVLVPASEKTHGHGTHTWAALWKEHLAALLAETAKP